MSIVGYGQNLSSVRAFRETTRPYTYWRFTTFALTSNAIFKPSPVADEEPMSLHLSAWRPTYFLRSSLFAWNPPVARTVATLRNVTRFPELSVASKPVTLPSSVSSLEARVLDMLTPCRASKKARSFLIMLVPTSILYTGPVEIEDLDSRRGTSPPRLSTSTPTCSSHSSALRQLSAQTLASSG